MHSVYLLWHLELNAALPSPLAITTSLLMIHSTDLIDWWWSLLNNNVTVTIVNAVNVNKMTKNTTTLLQQFKIMSKHRCDHHRCTETAQTSWVVVRYAVFRKDDWNPILFLKIITIDVIYLLEKFAKSLLQKTVFSFNYKLYFSRVIWLKKGHIK